MNDTPQVINALHEHQEIQMALIVDTLARLGLNDMLQKLRFNHGAYLVGWLSYDSLTASVFEAMRSILAADQAEAGRLWLSMAIAEVVDLDDPTFVN